MASSANTSNNGTARGQCVCGAVEYIAKMPAKWVAHCHINDRLPKRGGPTGTEKLP